MACSVDDGAGRMGCSRGRAFLCRGGPPTVPGLLLEECCWPEWRGTMLGKGTGPCLTVGLPCVWGGFAWGFAWDVPFVGCCCCLGATLVGQRALTAIRGEARGMAFDAAAKLGGIGAVELGWT